MVRTEGILLTTVIEGGDVKERCVTRSPGVAAEDINWESRGTRGHSGSTQLTLLHGTVVCDLLEANSVDAPLKVRFRCILRHRLWWQPVLYCYGRDWRHHQQR